MKAKIYIVEFGKHNEPNSQLEIFRSKGKAEQFAYNELTQPEVHLEYDNVITKTIDSGFDYWYTQLHTSTHVATISEREITINS